MSDRVKMQILPEGKYWQERIMETNIKISTYPVTLKKGEVEIWCDEYIVCPYCRHLNNPADSDGMAYSEDTKDYDCWECGKNFKLEVSVTHTWTTKIKG